MRLNLILFSFMFVDKNEQRTKSVHRSFLFLFQHYHTSLYYLDRCFCKHFSCGVPSLCTVHPQVCCFFLTKLIGSPVIISGENLRIAPLGSQYRCYEALVPIFQCSFMNSAIILITGSYKLTLCTMKNMVWNLN